jgi:hypothetical protein
MKYKASIKNSSGFKYLILSLSILLIISSITFKEILLFVIGFSILFMYFYILDKRMYVELYNDKIIYQGWLKKTEIRFKDISNITNAMDMDYPRNKYYGPFVYEVKSYDKSFLINLLYFDSEFGKKFGIEIKKYHKKK